MSDREWESEEGRAPRDPSAPGDPTAIVTNPRRLPLDADESLIEPGTWRIWRFHNRSRSWLLSSSQQTLQRSIERNGQQQAGLVRRVQGVPGIEAEVIFGMRRASACATLHIPFRAHVLPADTPDEVCVALMHSENTERESVSDLEQARNYRALITGGVFAGPSELSRALGLSQGWVSQIVKSSEVFDYPWLAEIIEPEVMTISISKATRLARALQTVEMLRLMRDRAHRLQDEPGTLTANQAIDRLLAQGRPGTKSRARTEVLAKLGRRKVAEMKWAPDGSMQLSVAPVEWTGEQTEELIRQVAARLRALFKDSQCGAVASGRPSTGAGQGGAGQGSQGRL